MKKLIYSLRSGIPSIPSSPASRRQPHATRGRRLAFACVLLCAALPARPCVATPFQWEYTGRLNTARGGHKATLLGDGRVLVVGGTQDRPGYLASAELYDAATATWTFTGSLNIGRTAHTLTLLSNGEGLVVAGVYGPNGSDYTASSELYDPATGNWIFTGSLNAARYLHTATLLPDGRVLVAGGLAFSGSVASAELYDPATGNWTFTGGLNSARFGQTATLLSDGRVLVAGGSNGANLASAELYDPATGNWSNTGSLNTARAFHTATLLPDGRVLVAGGSSETGAGLASAELYDPATGNWTLTGSLRTRSGHTATLLPDGKVLVAGGDCIGGHCIGGYTASAQLYDPATGSWTDTGSLNTPRSGQTATLLPNGKVLAAAGQDEPGHLASAELYDPGIVAATNVDGQGTFDSEGNEVTFTFRATQADDSSNLGPFTFCDSAAGVCVANARIQSLSITGNTADFSGSGRLQDVGRVTFRVRVTDYGSPGTSDTISISLSNGYSASGRLTSGNIRIY